MNIEDFLPKYPNIVNTEYPNLNPYKEDLNTVLFKKKEFNINRLNKVETFPKEKGELTKYQRSVATFLSSRTPYDKLLLIHAAGTGKTCSAIGAIEQIKNEENGFSGAIILVRGDNLSQNFTRELLEKCTAGQYIPEGYSKLTSLEKAHRIKKKIKYYTLDTFVKFAKKVKNLSDNNIIELYSNKIIIIDEVHNLRIQDDKAEGVDVYNEFDRFLHLVKNCKILLMSATPMKDSPDEIASVSNLILKEEDKLPTGKEFLKEYTDQIDGSYIIKKDKAVELKNKLKGKVSYLKEVDSDVPRKFLGDDLSGTFNYFKIDAGMMSKFQTVNYADAFNEDKKQSSIYINSREASLFIYPDGSYGNKGFKKYIKASADKKSYSLSRELYDAIYDEDVDKMLENIQKHSISYYKTIYNILETDGNCFVYSSIVQGSGAILFSLLLELFSFSKANGNEKTPDNRYAILTNITTPSSKEVSKIVNRFNQIDNAKGEYIKVIIGSKTVSEGFSFNNIVFEAINTPHWNYAETTQALARGTRLGSHNNLISMGIKPTVVISQTAAIPESLDDSSELQSIDLIMYKTSEIKDVSIRNILRLLMETAFDCSLNYLRNHIQNAEDYSRECDYAVCNYRCDGIDMKLLESEPTLDYSTYQLYYSNAKIPEILKRIESMFRENRKLSVETIINNLRDNYPQEYIENALSLLQQQEEKEELDFRLFTKLYSKSPVKQISNIIESMFKNRFVYSLQDIIRSLEQFTEFEILTALSNLINENTIIRNKYGFPSYLREQDNYYFLVDLISSDADKFIEYYSKNPAIYQPVEYNDILDNIYTSNLPPLITELSETSDERKFKSIIESLPIEVQEMLIETSIDAYIKNIEDDNGFREKILKFYTSYIIHIEDIWSSSLLKTLRCKKGDEEWKDCDEKYSEIIFNAKTQKEEKLKQSNPYGLIGKINTKTDSFCIVDYLKEEKGREGDRRLKQSGKVCGAGGWKLPDLLNIAILRLKIPAPSNFLPNITSKNYLIEKIISDEKLMEILEPDSLKNHTIDYLKTICYWGLTKKDGGVRAIKPLCQAIRNFLESKGLLIPDDQCGVQGKVQHARTKSVSPDKKVIPISTIFVIPNNQKPFFEGIVKDVRDIVQDCFGDKTIRIDIDDTQWIIIKLRKKLVGVVQIVNERIVRLCIAKNYKKQNYPQQAIAKVMNNIKEKYGKTIDLYIENAKIKNIKKMVNMYTDYGFRTKQATDRFTIMEYVGV